jgi:hypothetical protein
MGENRDNILDDSKDLLPDKEPDSENADEKERSPGISHKIQVLISRSIRDRYFIVAICIIIFAITIRWIELLGSGFYRDEANEALIAASLGDNLSPSFLIKEGEILHILVTSISFSIFGVSELSGRFPVFVFSILTIILAMMFSRELFKDKRTSLVVGFLLAISAWHIKWSIILRPYSMLMFLGLLTMFFAVKYFRTRKNLYAYLMSITLLAAVFTSRFGFIMPLVLFGYLLLKKESFNRTLIIALSPTAVLLGVGIVYVILHKDFDLVQKEIANQWWVSTEPSFYMVNIYNNLSFIGILFLFAGSYLIIREENVDASTLILLICVYIVFLSSVFISKIDRYITIIIPPVFMIIGYSFIRIMDRFKPRISYIKLFSLFTLCLIVLGDIAYLTPARPENGYRQNYEVDWREASHYIHDNWNEGDFLLATVGEPVEFYFREADYNLFDDWEEASDLIWRKDVAENSTVWLMVDHGRYFKSLQKWQQDWIWKNFDLVWESDQNYVFRSSIFDKVWKDAIQVVKEDLGPDDIILCTEENLNNFFEERIHVDWNETVAPYNVEVSDVIWRNGIPNTTSVWYLIEKSVFFNDFQYWQRDWVFRNFEVEWESQYTYVYRSEGE